MNINLGLTADATGTVDVITATYSPAPTLVDKKILFLVASGANVSTTPTFAPNGLTAHTIVKKGGQALVAGDIAAAGHCIILEYNLANTHWELLNPATSSLGYTAENVANKDTDGTLAANSDTKYASQKATKTYADTKQTALGYTPENVANKDASGGYAGLTLFKLNLKNTLGTITSFFTTAATIARTWTMPDKDGTVAMTSDITGTNSGTNTGDETAARIGALINGASAATPNDTDLVATAESSVLKKITWTNVKAFLKTYFDGIYQSLSGKDATGGYAGLTLFKINFKNAANTFTSFFTNANTAARTYTFQNRDGTIADDTDLALKAALASPALTGNPTAPTQAGGDNSTKLATTAYVDAKSFQSYFTRVESLTPADATSYHYGYLPGASTTATQRTFKFSFAGTLDNVSHDVFQTNATSNEAVTLYLRNVTTSTDYTIGTFTTDAGASISKGFVYSNLGIAVNTTDDYVVKILTPTWGTNPTAYNSGTYLNVKSQ